MFCINQGSKPLNIIGRILPSLLIVSPFSCGVIDIILLIGHYIVLEGL